MTTETKPKHTPLPWKKRYYHTYGEETQLDIVTLNNDRIATVVLWGAAKGNKEEADNNAEVIFRACNSHYELLKVLKQARAGYKAYIDILVASGTKTSLVVLEALVDIDAAIAKATDQSSPAAD